MTFAARCIVLLALALATSFAAAPEKPFILLISGEYEYKSAETFAQLEKDLEAKFAVECQTLTRPKDPKLQIIDGLEALERADLIVLQVRRMTLPDDQIGRIRAYVRAGKPVVALRTSSHAFENWKEFDVEVLGGNYGKHLANDLKTTVTLAAGAESHPIVSGFKTFVSAGSLYRNTPLRAEAKPLLYGHVSTGETHPVAWTHSANGARVFYTSLGHPDDFREPAFRQMLENGMEWALQRPLKKK